MHPHEPALQRLDPPASRPGRDPSSRPVAREPAGLGRSLGSGRGRAAGEDSRVGDRATAAAWTCSQASSNASAVDASEATGQFADRIAIASSTRSRAPPGARRARLPRYTWEAPVLAQVGGTRLDNAVLAQVIAALGCAGERPWRSTAPGSNARCAISPSSTPRGSLGDETYLARLGELRASEPGPRTDSRRR